MGRTESGRGPARIRALEALPYHPDARLAGGRLVQLPCFPRSPPVRSLAKDQHVAGEQSRQDHNPHNPPQHEANQHTRSPLPRVLQQARPDPGSPIDQHCPVGIPSRNFFNKTTRPGSRLALYHAHANTAGLHASAAMGLSGRLEFDSSNHGL
jgi:hypothetical protein